jgi:curved DNA-binding protein CbpA
MKVVSQAHPAAELAQRGNLHSTPFADLLVALLDLRKHGTLRIADASGQVLAQVRFEAGLPVAARAARLEPNLIQSLIPLCACANGDYVFSDGRDDVGSGEGVVEGRVDPLALIAAVFRGPAREDAVGTALAGIGPRLLLLHPRIRIERYRFTQQEQQVVELLRRGPLGLPELESYLPARTVRRVVYVLHVTRGLSPVSANRRVVSGTIEHVAPLPVPTEVAEPTVRQTAPLRAVPVSAPPRAQDPSPPPRAPGRYHMHEPDAGAVEQPLLVFEALALPPALQLWAKDIRQRAALVRDQDHYAALGVTQSCSELELQRAYAALSVRFAPDSLPDELAALRARAARLHARLSEAYQTLLDPARRQHYDEQRRNVPRTLDPRSQQGRIVQADTHYREAERLLRVSDYPAAFEQAQQALRGHRSARNEALYAWLLCLRSGTADGIHPRALPFLDSALHRDPQCIEAHYYKAMVLKRAGQLEQARQEFRRVLKLSPEHLEAARELRLQDMRQTSRSSAGLLARLFSRAPGEKPDES